MKNKKTVRVVLVLEDPGEDLLRDLQQFIECQSRAQYCNPIDFEGWKIESATSIQEIIP